MWWVLILLIVGLVGIGAAVASWWPLPSALHLPHGVTRASATVLTSAPCGPQNARDEVEVRLDGRTQKAQLDGCGHREGEVLDVDVPANAPQDGLVVQISGTARIGGPGLAGRLSIVLLVLSAVSGATYAFLIRAQPARV